MMKRYELFLVIMYSIEVMAALGSVFFHLPDNIACVIIWTCCVIMLIPIFFKPAAKYLDMYTIWE